MRTTPVLRSSDLALRILSWLDIRIAIVSSLAVIVLAVLGKLILSLMDRLNIVYSPVVVFSTFTAPFLVFGVVNLGVFALNAGRDLIAIILYYRRRRNYPA